MLTELEKSLVSRLAENGPLSGYDFHLGGKRQRKGRKAIMSSGYWQRAKKKLGSKGKNLIVPVRLKGLSSTDERGRRRDLYWLTENGIVAAIRLGTRVESLLKNVKKVYPNDKEKALLVELSKITDKEFLATAFHLRQTTKVDVNTILNLTIIASSQGLGTKEIPKKFFELDRLLRKYPKYHKMARRVMQRNVKALHEFLRISKGAKP